MLSPLSVVDFDTVTDSRDGFSGLVIHVQLPNGAVTEVSVAFSTRDHTVNVSSVVHCGSDSYASPTSLFFPFSPCVSYPTTSAVPDYVN